MAADVGTAETLHVDEQREDAVEEMAGDAGQIPGAAARAGVGVAIVAAKDGTRPQRTLGFRHGKGEVSGDRDGFDRPYIARRPRCGTKGSTPPAHEAGPNPSATAGPFPCCTAGRGRYAGYVESIDEIQ